MTRTQIQLPDELYRRAKRFGEQREIYLAEMARRGIELFLERFPGETGGVDWRLPEVDGGGIRVPLERLYEVAGGEEAGRSGNG
jgi:hypothetical protein